jgi:enoyl-[acyl-carrier protein] reductase II
MEASIALTGQVAGRIDDVRPVAEILRRMMDEFYTTIAGMAHRYSEVSA